ncbi:MAG TPA: hypothetical protein VFB16_00515 [Bauldia sp.]|nr:hypothetical protein [Bauldia sp.]
MPSRRLVACLALGLAAMEVCAGAASAAPDGFRSLPVQKDVIELDGKTVGVRYTPSFKGKNVGGVITLDILVDGDLTELQHSIGLLLDGPVINQGCGDYVTVHSSRIGVVGDRARLTGGVHYERWTCLRTPVLKRTLRLNTKPVRARTLVQNATVCVDVSTRVDEGGRQVEFIPTVTCAQPSTSSVVGKIEAVIGIERFFRGLAQSAVNQLRDQLILFIPPEIRAYNVRITDAKFTDRGEGALGLRVTGVAVLSTAEFREFLANMIH